MDYLAQQIINGIALGSIYGLIAIGYTMVYGIIGMVNFAHGEVFMISAFIAVIAFLLMNLTGMASVPGMLVAVLALAMLFTAAYGWAVERLAYRPVRGISRLAPLISAIGMSIVLQNSVQLLQGARVKPVPAVVTGGIDLFTGTALTVRISYIQALIFLVTIVLMTAFSLVITRTSLGRQQRACEQDMGMAALLGIDVGRTVSVTFILGATLAAVAGTMVTLYYGVIDFYIGFLAGVKAFTAAVLGGIGSLPGAMLGGMLIGLIETVWSAYFAAEYKDVATFGILVLVLVFLPTGLLGRPEVEKV